MVHSKTSDPALAIFPGALGDLVCAAAALAALRKRHGRLDLVLSEPLSWLARPLVGARAVATLEDRRWAAFFSACEGDSGGWRLGRRPALYSWLGAGNDRFRRALSALSEAPPRFYRLPRGEGEVHVTREYLSQVDARGASAPPKLEARLRRGIWPGARGRGRGQIRLLVHPGSGSPRKRWDPACFGEIIEWWIGEVGGEATVLLGPAERAEAERWASGGARVVRDLSLEEAAGLIADAQLFLGNDSGISHLAGAVGARGAVVFGATDPYRWAPLGGELWAIAPLGRLPTPCGAKGGALGEEKLRPKVHLVPPTQPADLELPANQERRVKSVEYEARGPIAGTQVPVSEVKRILGAMAREHNAGE